ncbi:MAG TPA: hypothetical protein VFQ80_01935, partial [Thermomicrobiales bacterium]|nr:hypothetical protein [Thermomicrobiales bacterium]
MAIDNTARLVGWTNPSLERAVLDDVSLDAPWSIVEGFATLVRLSGSAEERRAVTMLTNQLDAWGVPYRLHEPVCFISLPIAATVRDAAAGGASFR